MKRKLFGTSGIRGIVNVDPGSMLALDVGLAIRPSGTEPLIRLTVEAGSTEKARWVMNKGTKLVKKVIMEAAT